MNQSLTCRGPCRLDLVTTPPTRPPLRAALAPGAELAGVLHAAPTCLLSTPDILAQVMAVWDFEAAVERRDATGGTSKRSVLEQAAKLEAWASGEDARAGGKRQKTK